MWESIFGLLCLGLGAYSYIYKDFWYKVREESLEKHFPNKGGQSEKFGRFYEALGSLLFVACGVGLIVLGASRVFG